MVISAYELAAYLEPQVQHPVALDHHVRILEQVLALDAAEVALPRSENSRTYCAEVAEILKPPPPPEWSYCWSPPAEPLVW